MSFPQQLSSVDAVDDSKKTWQRFVVGVGEVRSELLRCVAMNRWATSIQVAYVDQFVPYLFSLSAEEMDKLRARQQRIEEVRNRTRMPVPCGFLSRVQEVVGQSKQFDGIMPCLPFLIWADCSGAMPLGSYLRELAQFSKIEI